MIFALPTTNVVDVWRSAAGLVARLSTVVIQKSGEHK